MKQQLKTALLKLVEQKKETAQGAELYAAGGCVRDMLFASSQQSAAKDIAHNANEADNFPESPADIDIVVKSGCHSWVKTLAEILGGGAVVPLSDTEGEKAARLVWQGEQLDFADYRYGAQSIEEDLWLRDFTINAMALPLPSYLAGNTEALIDPTKGRDDLANGILRHLPNAFTADPLRMLRAYRFSAKYGFGIADATKRAIYENICAGRNDNQRGINEIAPERVSYELRHIFDSPRTYQAVLGMAQSGLLRALLPELYFGEGVEQPKEFHHLDVLQHGFLTLQIAEKIAAAPEQFCPNPQLLKRLRSYLEEEGNPRRLKWAALLHDIGKPAAKEIDTESSRVSFHGHDKISQELFTRYAERSRWSIKEQQQTAQLISLHMHPFHLLTAKRKGELSQKGVLRFYKRGGRELYGLFLLALSDTLAGNPKHHKEMTFELLQFFEWVERVHREKIEPLTTHKPLINGDDLIALGIVPGALFRTIFTAVEEGQIEGKITDKEMAIDFVRKNFIPAK